MPPNTVYVGRPSKWGNPFNIDESRSREKAVEEYNNYIKKNIASGKIDITELKGKNLACFCRLDQPCHADVLLKLSN
tara:strand:- start:243 stop:473 length:231 start_codon:yes stop_codon:yes gene_type:complete